MVELRVESRGTACGLVSNTPGDPVLPIKLIEKGSEVRMLQTTLSRFRKALKENRGVAFFDLHVPTDTAMRHAIVKKVEVDDRTRAPREVTMMSIADDDRIRIHVPVNADPVPKCVRDGKAMAVRHCPFLVVRSCASKVPEELVADLEDCAMGEKFEARHLKLPRGVELVSDPNTLLYSIEHLPGVPAS